MFALQKEKNTYSSLNLLELTCYPTTIKRKKVNIVAQDFKDLIIRKKYLPDFNKLVEKIIDYLDDEDEGSAEGVLDLYDELAFERNFLLEKYEKYLSKYEKEHYMKTIRLLANELKQRSYKYEKKTIYHKTR